MERKLQKIYLTYYNLLIVQDLSNFANNLSQGVHRIKCKFRHDDTNVKHVELNISIVTVFFNTQILKMI